MHLSSRSFTWCYRVKWQLIRALQIFAEHVVFKHEEMTVYMKRLQLVRVIINVDISAIL